MNEETMLRLKIFWYTEIIKEANKKTQFLFQFCRSVFQFCEFSLDQAKIYIQKKKWGALTNISYLTFLKVYGNNKA